MDESSDVASAHSFGRYRVTKSLGSGAMGEVYEAIDDVLGREVAIKTLRTSSGLGSRFVDERFRNEARAIAQFSHPGVVQVFDIDLAANPPYLVMERVAGPSLEIRLKKSGPMPVEQLVPLGIQIARALAAAHAAGVVHRDVKPSNVLGAGEGVWKLADFGVAHVPDSSVTMTGQFVGSPAYAAPEALVKGVSAPPGDVYGLGATLYEAAAGKWPRVEAQGALLAPVPPLRELVPNLPAHVASAIDRAVSLEAAKRPTATELADLIAGVSDESPRAAPPAARPASHPLARRAVRWQPIAIGGALVLVLILVIALTRGSGDAKNAPPVAPTREQPKQRRTFTEEELPPLGEIDLSRPPRNMSEKAARDWQKVDDAIVERDLDEAVKKLDEWERKYYVCEETDYLRAQLDRLMNHLDEGGGKKKKKKKD